MENYVIIGNGVAAAACMEGIRSTDRTGSITVISEEKHAVYCRPLISYYLEGKTDPERMRYRSEDFYEKMNAAVLYGTRAEKIDAEKREVLLSDGSALPYTRLCMATGSSPFVPPFAGLDTVPEKYSFMTLDDALALQAAVRPDSRVLIVGAGLIGLKCAEGLWGSVASLTVCDLADRILSSILDAEGAAMVQKHLEERGIRFLLSDSVERFDRNTAFMKSERQVEFDVLVLAVGVRANTGLLREIGGAVNRGILVDERMRTDVEDIFAAGDCTEGDDVSFGKKRVLALLPNAYLQGYCAGVNMAGEDRVFDCAIPMNSMGILGLHMMTAGTYCDAAQGGEVYVEKSDGKLKKLFCRDGVMTGFILIGETTRAGIYTSMIRNRTPLDTVNFEMLKKIPTSAAFSEETRRKMFGGVV